MHVWWEKIVRHLKKNQNENMIFFCFEKATKELYIEIYF